MEALILKEDISPLYAKASSMARVSKSPDSIVPGAGRYEEEPVGIWMFV